MWKPRTSFTLTEGSSVVYRNPASPSVRNQSPNPTTTWSRLRRTVNADSSMPITKPMRNPKSSETQMDPPK